MSRTTPPKQRPLLSTLPPELEDIDAGWGAESQGVRDTSPDDLSERVTQVPSEPPDQMARRLNAQAASLPPARPRARPGATTPPPGDDVFTRETLLDPVEHAGGAPHFGALARDEATLQRRREVPPVLGGYASSAPPADNLAPSPSASGSRAPASALDLFPQASEFSLAPPNTRPSTLPPARRSVTPLARPPVGDALELETLDSVPPPRRDSSELSLSNPPPPPSPDSVAPAAGAAYEAWRRSAPTQPRRRALSSLDFDLDAAPLARDALARDEAGRDEAHLLRAERAALAPVTSGLELAQRFSSIPPPAADPVRDMKDRFAMGDFSGALEVAEQILRGAPHQPDAQQCATHCRDVLTDMYASRVGDLQRQLKVVMSADQLRWLSLDHRAGFILSMIDGASSVDELLDVCGMPRLDALRILCGLLDQQVIRLQ